MRGQAESDAYDAYDASEARSEARSEAGHGGADMPGDAAAVAAAAALLAHYLRDKAIRCMSACEQAGRRREEGGCGMGSVSAHLRPARRMAARGRRRVSVIARSDRAPHVGGGGYLDGYLAIGRGARNSVAGV